MTRVTDRDLKSNVEVADLKASGVRVLSRRNIEGYLLDDEVIEALCDSVDRPDLHAEARKIKADSMTASQSRGNDPDDWKKAGSQIQTDLRKLLSLTNAGSTWDAFARDTLAPLLRPHMATYIELKNAIFGA